MRLKGINKLNKNITAMVNEYICEDITCKFNTCFAMAEDRLYYSLFVDEDMDRDWQIWLHDTYGDRYSDDFSTFVLTFLHEVGHYFTEDDFDDDVEKKQALVIDADLDDEETTVSKRRTYWELPVEKAATDWAIDFYNNNKEQMKNFYKDVMTFISNFYNKNEVDYYEDEEEE